MRYLKRWTLLAACALMALPMRSRLFVQNLSEDGWLHVARTIQTRPPMPWWSLRDTTDDDLRAMYQYIRSLTPAGPPAPSFLPPDQVPPRPYQQLPDMS